MSASLNKTFPSFRSYFHACSCFADPSSHLLLSCVFALSVKYQPADVSLAVSCGLLPALDLLSRDAALHPYTMLPPREWLAARDVHTILQVSSYRLLQVIAVTVGWVLFSQFSSVSSVQLVQFSSVLLVQFSSVQSSSVQFSSVQLVQLAFNVHIHVSSYRLLQVIAVTVGWVLFSSVQLVQFSSVQFSSVHFSSVHFSSVSSV